MPDDKTWPNDMLARVLAVILTGVSMAYASFTSSDRFTGTQGAVHDQRLQHLEEQVRQLPPEWLRRDLVKIEQRLERIEGHMEMHRHEKAHE